MGDQLSATSATFRETSFCSPPAPAPGHMAQETGPAPAERGGCWWPSAWQRVPGQAHRAVREGLWVWRSEKGEAGGSRGPAGVPEDVRPRGRGESWEGDRGRPTRMPSSCRHFQVLFFQEWRLEPAPDPCPERCSAGLFCPLCPTLPLLYLCRRSILARPAQRDPLVPPQCLAPAGSLGTAAGKLLCTPGHCTAGRCRNAPQPFLLETPEPRRPHHPATPAPG